MNRLVIGLLLTAGMSLLLINCSSDKNSTEACLHETTLNLDKGNYDAVLASTCANTMQKGAAYFGKAGFDIRSVINNFSETGSSSSSAGTQSDLNVYMTALVGKVDGTSLTYMDLAKSEYSSIPPTNGGYKDAQFYVSLVDAVKSLSLIKIVLPNILDANGDLNTACDKNSNSVPDDADATACALIAAAQISTGATVTCSGANYVRSTPVDLTLTTSATGTTVQGTYSGLIISMATGTGPTSGCSTIAPNPNNTTYKRLLYKDTTTGSYWVATTTTDICVDAIGNQWPCPIIQNNQPLDLVTALNDSLNSSLSSLSSSLTGTTGTDVQQAIIDIQAQACCNCTSTPCTACASTNVCTSQDIATYLQTYLQ